MTQRTYPEGVPCWVDTEQPDVAAAAEFYGGLFGWTFEDAMPPGAAGQYLIARLTGRDVAGIASNGGGAASWNTYIAVDDADASVRRLVAAGAMVKRAPADAGAVGRGAILTDPEGVEFRIWQARARLGAQAVNEPGTWNFSDLHSTDPGAAAAFYTGAFGWQFDRLDFGTMIRRPGYGDHLEATADPDIRLRQSDLPAPAGFEDAVAWLVAAGPDEQPRWHVAFAVADRDRTVADAGRLGARILRQDETRWTREALIQDPQGALFNASQFTPPGAQESA